MLVWQNSKWIYQLKCSIFSVAIFLPKYKKYKLHHNTKNNQILYSVYALNLMTLMYYLIYTLYCFHQKSDPFPGAAPIPEDRIKKFKRKDQIKKVINLDVSNLVYVFTHEVTF